MTTVFNFLFQFWRQLKKKIFPLLCVVSLVTAIVVHNLTPAIAFDEIESAIAQIPPITQINPLPPTK
ncbi:hypothetical protein RintRC_3142 [Richelia intracellularis]|nr:hypothetical protein RintRC_3142 [Richelia intracellularis]